MVSRQNIFYIFGALFLFSALLFLLSSQEDMAIGGFAIGLIFMVAGYAIQRNKGTSFMTRNIVSGPTMSLYARNDLLEKSNYFIEFEYSVIGDKKSIPMVEYWIGVAIQYAGYKVTDIDRNDYNPQPPFNSATYERVIKGEEFSERHAKIHRAVLYIFTFIQVVILFTNSESMLVYYPRNGLLFIITSLIIDYFLWKYSSHRVPSTVEVVFVVDYISKDASNALNAKGGEFTGEIRIHLSVGLKADYLPNTEELSGKFNNLTNSLLFTLDILPSSKPKISQSVTVKAVPLKSSSHNRLDRLYDRFPLIRFKGNQ